MCRSIYLVEIPFFNHFSCIVLFLGPAFCCCCRMLSFSLCQLWPWRVGAVEQKASPLSTKMAAVEGRTGGSSLSLKTGLLLICTPGSSLSRVIPSNTCWGSSHRDRAFYFYILLRDAWLVPPRQFPLSTCVPARSLHTGLPAPSPEPLQSLKCDVWWRTPGRTTAFRAKQMLRALWCSGCLSDVVVVVNHSSSKTGAGSAPSEQTGRVFGGRDFQNFLAEVFLL